MKPGYKTTEFALTCAVGVGTVLASAADWLPPRYAAIASAGAVALYNVSRGLAKLWGTVAVPVVPTATVTTAPPPPPTP